ncbi:hypothetical protein ABT299_00220 [Spirillospora sp. NPDC000708]
MGELIGCARNSSAAALEPLAPQRGGAQVPAITGDSTFAHLMGILFVGRAVGTTAAGASS